jgi:cell filamentation protein
MRRLLLEIIDPDRVRALRRALDFLKKSRSVPWNDLYVATTVAGQTYSGVLVGRAPPDFMMRAKGDGQEWIAIGSIDDIQEDAASGDTISFTGRRWYP